MATFNRTCKIQTKCNTSENVICSIENTVLFRPLSFQNLVTVCVTHPNHLNIITAQGTPRSHQPLPQFKERAQKEPIAEWLSNKSIWTCVRTSLICRGPNPQATVHPLPVVCGRHQRSFVHTTKYPLLHGFNFIADQCADIVFWAQPMTCAFLQQALPLSPCNKSYFQFTLYLNHYTSVHTKTGHDLNIKKVAKWTPMTV